MKEIFMAGPWVTKEDSDIVMDALSNGWYGKNAYYYVEKFEEEFAAFHNRKYALMTPNCTTAIHLLLAGLGISDKDEVIAPDCTWIGSTAAIKYQRAKTIFADIDPINWCISLDSVKNLVTDKTRAIIAVDLYGNMPEFHELQEFCDQRGIYLIEDAAEALGSQLDGIKAGKFGVGSVFSFHRTKTITTGEGGMLLIDDQSLYERCKFLRDHGRKPGEYFNTEVTFKYMPFNVQAALGYAQFLRIEEIVSKKIWILHSFKNFLQEEEQKIQLNYEPKNVINGAWSPALVFNKNLEIDTPTAMKFLKKFNLPSRPFFYPLSSLPAYDEKKNYESINLNAYDISSRGICLPCSLNLEEEQIEQYCEVLKTLLSR